MREVKKKIAIAILTTMASGLVVAAAGVYIDVVSLKKDILEIKESKMDLNSKIDRIDNRVYEIYKIMSEKK